MEIVSLLYKRNEGYKVKFPVFIEDIITLNVEVKELYLNIIDYTFSFSNYSASGWVHRLHRAPVVGDLGRSGPSGRSGHSGRTGGQQRLVPLADTRQPRVVIK